MSRKAFRRRYYFVQRGPQGQFIAAFCLLALVGALATAIATATIASRTLRDAMFRAHFVESSTGELVVPVLLRVNGLAAAIVILCGLLAAVYLFRREARALDELCISLAAWRDGLEQEIAATRIAPSQTPARPAAPSRGWARALHDALRGADDTLRATYRCAAEEACQFAATAGRIESALSQETSKDGLAPDLQVIAERLAAIDAGLARFQSEGGE